MRIETDKQQVYKNIMQLTAVTARNRKNMEIAVTEDNLPAMGIYMAEGLTEAENELRRHLKSSSEFSLYDTASNIVLETKDILRAAESTTGQIKSSMTLYLTHYAISRWVSDIETAKDLAEPYSNSAGGYLSKLQALICQRDEYEVPENAYEARKTDSTSIEYENTSGMMAEAMTRKRDVQPVRRVWPDGVITDIDSAILQDENGAILVTKT